ncbi:SNF2 family N-terminal domain-containing protein [Hypoxylon fragiforme]|uniref:SNF2 family N-terminal domain-containing protein n=1 Tax=Hypoxylon fragiforme TaxID=63214 RepID=UPI0020C6656E|nr:SNF2 family N-terminal domain-containing protein [Hypoxylon fragiforme]KAI2612594.1 SNF2 family N-terminal domain-containing protein [Hypoxylon fragiforme]
MAFDSGSGDGVSAKPNDAQPQQPSVSIAEQITTIVQEASTPDSGAEIDISDISDVSDDAAALKNLTTGVRDQEDLERDITHQASIALIDAENKKDEKRIEKVEATLQKLSAQKKTQEEQFRKAIGKPELKQTIRAKIAAIEEETKTAQQDITDLRARIEQRIHEGANAEQAQGGSRRLPNETYRQFLIRTGKITPFANIGLNRPQGDTGDLADALGDAEDEAAAAQLGEELGFEARSHQNLRAPGFDEEPKSDLVVAESKSPLPPRKKRKLQRKSASSDDFVAQPSSDASEADFIDDQDDQESEDSDNGRRRKKPKKAAAKDGSKVDLSKIDDGNEASYQTRIADWADRRSRARRRRRQERRDQGSEEDDSGDEDECFKPSPDHASCRIQNGLKVPGDIYPALYDYQKTGVQWLSELYHNNVGGIVGDEMGLGKTIQIIAFIAALHHSKRLEKPVIVVAPATVLKQWANEFHRWWPPLRVSILHSSGSGMLNVKAEGRIEEDDEAWDEIYGERQVSKAAKKIVDRVVEHGHVLVTTYAGLQTYGQVLTPVEWSYAVLDEGHMIRNPNSAVTVYCKELRTPNRVILSGTPMQNNLIELWSLFDFIYPMRLGTLVDFRNQFEIPIRQGGYANAGNLQIMTAQKCAEVLKDTISPYLIQRLKVDVAADLPKKTEQVLFCSLTRPQQEAYETFLQSKEMEAVVSGKRNALFGIDILRKICNHPDLISASLKIKKDYHWGSAKKSGKMQVVKALLQTWKRFKHKTLLFCQGVQMLDVLESFVKRLGYIKYLRMDGGTAIKGRQSLVDQFNNDPDIDVFLLTTKVGGLGVNLTGANRVIIFDPDWNPSTDAQARERAWRLGQKKEVTIYRLMTAGTIEEKMYHRQIYKQFLSNKVLKDPKQLATFQMNDLHDLFKLETPGDGVTETGKLFKDSEVQFSKPSTADGAKDPGQNATDSRDQTKTSEDPANDDHDRELHTIEGVAGVEEYKPDADGEDTPGKSTEEDRIMQGLFSRSGVHSALEHDKIVNGKRQVRADPRMLLHEANRAAAEAAASLQRAREQTRSVPIGTVTWTGDVGQAGRPSNARRSQAIPESGSILSGLANRQGRSSRPGPSSSARTTNLGVRDFAGMIPKFIREHNGRVATQHLVDHFDQYCGTKKQSDAFRTALDRVADMKKRGSVGYWTLK